MTSRDIYLDSNERLDIPLVAIRTRHFARSHTDASHSMKELRHEGNA
ncbi:hypothetical protein X949_5591 [Burkholderia pseudomallei MSHR5609]|nr:hypothetical protein DO73_4046 [Burkholderia pseudomallei]KGS53757.1 hypothetical protein X949_5591 [Burkholderia pseudomallei MSHR5609]